MTALDVSEREVVLTIADDERSWSIFTDSTRLTRRLLRVAAQWGMSPARCGAGFEFTLPLTAVKFSGPRRLTDAQKSQLTHARAARRKARFRAGGLVAPSPTEGQTPGGVS